MAFTETGHNSGDVFILEFATALFSVPNNYRTSWEDIKDLIKTFFDIKTYVREGIVKCRKRILSENWISEYEEKMKTLMLMIFLLN